jgi:HTH-type transcriptional regulator / antitoxin HigA
MPSDTRSTFQPDYAVLPGETVHETISALGITQAELAERTGRPRKTINEIIRGKAAITPETALQFEKVLGVPASFWNALEQQYRAALARDAEREQLERQLGWLRTMPVKAMVKKGWLPSFDEPLKQLESLLSFYGVASVEAWRAVWADLRATASYRKAEAFETDFAAVTAWLRKGELEARLIKTQPFDAKAFRTALDEIRALTLDPSTAFVQRLIELCGEAGVAVCFVPELPKLRVCGATRWLTPEKALVQLSLRYKTNDQLWFTFFHEAGHILLHGKRAVFVEEANGAAKGIAGSAEPKRKRLKEEEQEANEFAQDLLIPPADYTRFVADGHFSRRAITTFASEIGIHPGIVLGRLQRDRRVPFPTPLNRYLKHSYRFAGE